MKVSGGYRKRCKRYNVPGHAHGLTFTCFRNRTFLRSDNVCQILVESIEKARATHAFDLWAWVIMPEHVHMLIHPRDEIYTVSDILRSVKHPVAFKILRSLRAMQSSQLKDMRTGLKKPKYRLWQPGGGHDRNLTEPGAIYELVDYIHYNPVRRGLVEKPEDWPWSSARAWLLDETGPLRINKESFPLL